MKSYVINISHILFVVIREDDEIIEKQLDYVLVSNRWLSAIKDANVRWGPSEHRNMYGRADHALVDCEIKWRIRSPKATM